MRSRWSIALAVLAVLSPLGCSRTVGGDPVGAAQPTATAVDVGKLNAGRYPTTASAPLGNADSEQTGRLVEGRRMTGYVVGPWQVDPELIGGGAAGARVLTERKDLGTVMWPAISAAAWNQPFLAGFSSERNARDPKEPTLLRNAVLRFATAESAAATARGMASTAMNMPTVLNTDSPIPAGPIRGVPIPGHPDVSGALLAHLEGDTTVQELIVASAHGPYVLLQVAQSAQGPDRAAASVGRTLDLQVPLIDRFEPTDPAQFAALPLDPTGLVARTLPVQAEGDSMSNAAYDPAGALQLEDNPVAAGAAFADGDVDVVSAGRTTVYQAADPAKAQQLAEALGDDVAQRVVSRSEAVVPGLPQSRCVGEQAGLIPRTWCFAGAGRFAIKAVARQLDNAQQQIAAQYLMLVG